MSHHKKLNIEASLKRSISQAPGLDFEKLAAIPVIKMTEHDTITRQQAPSTKKNGKMARSFKPFSIAFAGALVMLVCVTTWFGQFKSPESIIALDAKQSVEIVTNKQRQILTVKAYDQNVQTLLDAEDLNQSNLEASVAVIITTMIKNGYLDDSKSVVMVTVENKSTAKADDLATSLNQVIKDSATAENISATVVSQTVSPDSQALTEAGQYNVSTGKLNVMKELVIADSSLKMDALAAMSLTDLIEVSKEKSVDLSKVIKSDEPTKETKDLSKPTTPNAASPAVTPPATETIPETPSETTSESNSQTKGTQATSPAPIVTPAVTVVPPSPPTEPPVTEVTLPEKDTEKETEAIDGEKKPLGQSKPEEPDQPEEPEEPQEPEEDIK